MRLFRQKRLGDWETVFAGMAAEVRRMLQGKPRSSEWRRAEKNNEVAVGADGRG
jgi:hypothetical protein